MLGKLNEKQIEDLLKKQVTGRLGCHADGITYVVPINYFYRDPYIFAHSAKGRKIDMMRKNPKVCFQVDDIQSVFKWQSVIAWGKYEEITDFDEKQQAMQGLIHRIMPLVDKPAEHPHHAIAEKESEIDTKIEVIVYKITLSKKSGRFENS
ncbi:pyridoxamine 5'-phosphate oxidase family protein [Mucilaginibacter gotjawali]|uniref:Uncharacterized protein n=2 Tax=Mucilaginibacter gotjawali TaxID=1550579 RepID=A0A839S8S3_9SPHI|nr:pyridoxamine 5'-phosphate oxidase family protein [Mucilaginibacter gotjawali]MBB3053754.1 hypothetical protein [Mucilaginibacter gotjawali]BAU54014.1 Pyridoxamine 5'-phosphate oxidase [Mucilaginibacter gotjawali]